MGLDRYKMDRQERHDQIQAERRTTAQNEAIIRIIEGEQNGMKQGWAYSTIHETGETVEVQRCTPSLKCWKVEADGTTTEQTTPFSGL